MICWNIYPLRIVVDSVEKKDAVEFANVSFIALHPSTDKGLYEY